MRKHVPLKKRLLQSGPATWLAAFLISLWMRFVYLTSKVERHWPENMRAAARGEVPTLFCFWHGRLIMHPLIKPPRPHYVLISRHSDGALSSAVIRCFGIDTVHGSRGKGVKSALEHLKKVAADGGNISITPDGPRGPFQVAAPGAAYVAALTGYPVVATGFSCTRYKRFKSWDRFMLPKPFGRIVFVAERVPVMLHGGEEGLEQAELDRMTKKIEETLNRVTAEADRLCGVSA